jgi:DNA-binding NarL/FixJ family response regulator
MAYSESAITVLVVEDNEALRGEFVGMIEAAPGIDLLAAVGSLSEARAALRRHGHPDVLIIDLGLPDGDGAALISELSARAPQTSALVVTIFGDEGHVVRALEAGAKGYLLKDAMLEEFARAVRLVHAGGSPLSPSIARHLLKRFAPAALPSRSSRNGTMTRTESLTAREAEILQLIAAGHSIPETAAALALSPHTVSTHVKHIYAKLAVSSRVQAVNRARATGQID